MNWIFRSLFAGFILLLIYFGVCLEKAVEFVKVDAYLISFPYMLFLL
jgi:hypothetical protein